MSNISKVTQSEDTQIVQIEEINKSQSEIEKSIEVLHGDIRSINRQIRQRKLKIEIEESFSRDTVEIKDSFEKWLKKVEHVINNKFDQIRMLERTLGDLRSKSINNLSRAHLHVRILKEIALQLDDAFLNMEEAGAQTFKTADVDKLRKLLDDLENMWPELFQ